MRISTLCVIWTSLASALLLNACSHEWDGLDVLPGGSSSGDATSSSSGNSSSSGGAGGGGSSSSSGNGGGSSSSSSSSGGNDCAPLLPPVSPCDNLEGTFDDPVKFDADWYLANGNGTIAVDNGEAAIHLDAGDGASFASTHPDFDLNACGIWVELTEVSAASDVMTRLSIGTPFSMSHYSVGVINQKFEVHISSTSVFSIPFDATEMRHVRIREEGGKVYFGHSSDARCWKEVFNAPNTVSGMVEGRISVAHVPNGPGSAADGRFDNYCVQPP